MQLRSCPSVAHQRNALRSVSYRGVAPVRGRQPVVVRAAAEDEDAELEKRLAKLRQAKGATPYGQGTKAAPAKAAEEPAPAPKKKKEKVVYDYSDEVLHYEGPPHRGDLAVNMLLGTTLFWLPLTAAAVGRGLFVKYRFTDKRISVQTTAPWKKKEKVVYDYSDEVLHYEGPPHRGDLAVNMLLGTTLFWLPLTAAAVGRGLFVKYRFTDKRISVQTTAPWKNEQLDAAYQEVKEVRSIPRGVGAWGDMVVVLKDGSKIEMRALDKFRELQAYILARRDALAPRSNDLTQEELLGEPVAKKSGKGFA
ncbi:hypothetical protein GPECTOR_91g554 [Gonium pectorale]|uniref:YdbS-like PH domain-containing protein n=1 Tax=Gonium pectorale TaxID=33097 RepID=A0A150G269_GONPE|nr:hypothetical protein GPECTOR_91g554 [Gonium pectorale]|eukprot:KXZ43400.1 hypothetical protein GPECTOR_91g554 [Gonium pectorale]